MTEDTPRQDTEIVRVRQEDFLSQLAEALRLFDHDGDGVISEDDWAAYAQEMRKAG